MAFSMDDFKMDLRKTLTPSHQIWSASGYSVAAPRMGTVIGVNGCYSPPFAAPDLTFALRFTVNGHTVEDAGSKGKEDCGLLYAGGDWLPDRILRQGTYHYRVNGKLLSFSVTSELVPLFGTAGFGVRVTAKNRAGEPLELCATPFVTPGHPRVEPLANWEFTPPRGSEEEARPIGETMWENSDARVTLLEETRTALLGTGESVCLMYAVVLTGAGAAYSDAENLAALLERTTDRWHSLLALASERLPTVKSDIPGLAAYYNRSIVSGLVSLWENDAYVTNPFPATSGVDGGSICCYPWDVAGYSAKTLVMLLGGKALDFLKAMLDSGIDKHISMALDGGGLGWCPYSYSMWSLVNLYATILAFTGKGEELFDEIVRVFKAEEDRLPEWEDLKDYGRQHNLLEMRTSGYEYFVVSPNAERAWCYDLLAEIGRGFGKELSGWHTKAEAIRASIQRNLWDETSGWFKCLHPNGHVEMIYSIQMYDVLKYGVCDDTMTDAMLSHLRDGAFLGKYGVSSVSAEDTVHYELNDPDWSGGGSYTGDGPDLAEALWNIGRPEEAWDVLSRHLWMGEQLLYYPQEHYCDIPAVPHNKRANIIAGTKGMQAVLFGMAGITVGTDGGLVFTPHTPKEGTVEIIGFRHGGKTIDLLLQPNFVLIKVDGEAFYEGKPKTIRI